MKKKITTKNLILRFPSSKDLSLLKDFENRNKTHLSKWEPRSELASDENYKARLVGWKNECDARLSARFFIFKKDNPDRIIGMCNFNNIIYGAFKACYLGYKIDSEYEGKGLMFEALQHSIQYIFEELHLHRIMANYMPINTRSAKLLERLGFVIEGFAKNYLLINDRWEDHVLTALSFEQWKNP